MSEPPQLPPWLLEEAEAWPADAWGVRHARLLLRDGRVLAPVAILGGGELAGWGEAGDAPFRAEDIVAIEPADE